jgi:hypothetical protein
VARLAWLVVLFATALAAGAQMRDRTLVVTPKEIVAGEARHALVIGNSAYANGPLRNPVNDARAMAKALGEAGFNVTLLEDATQPAMHRAVRAFGSRIAKGGVGLFYYAGHGIQAKGRNYLIPVNADINQEYEIEFSSIDVNLVLATMDSAKNALNIVILDACRNNPFARAFRNAQAGLAQMEAPTGTFIAFATAPGAVAADGSGEHGVYTKYLLGEIAKPGVPIELVFKQVRNGVMTETDGRQTPWESSSLRGDFFFRAPQGAGAQPPFSEMLAEALRKERATQQREMERLIQAALERQRNQFEQQAPPRPVALPGEPAPPPVALVRPSEPAPSLSARFPREGDRWTYRLIEPQRRGAPKERRYTVLVAAVNESVILERFRIEGGASGDWAHDGGKYLASLGRSLFSPYLSVFEELAPSARLGSIEIKDENCKTRFLCEAQGRIVGRETIKVAAGTFDTVKVVVQHSWRPIVTRSHVASTGWTGTRELAVWYSPSVKRAVKFSNRFGELYSSYRDHLADVPDEGDFDLELESYRLQ